VSQEESEHNEVDEMKKGVDSTGEVMQGNRAMQHVFSYTPNDNDVLCLRMILKKDNDRAVSLSE